MSPGTGDAAPPPPLVIANARVVTPRALGAARGKDMARIDRLPETDVIIDRGLIVSIGGPRPADATVFDAQGCALLPGFIDAHTHLCWAGERLSEWERMASGVPYLEILRAGGGIMSTVRAVRAADERSLAELLAERLWAALDTGTTTIEVKSGYGLTLEHELKMLRAILAASARWPGTVLSTALLGHAIDPEFPGGRSAFIDHVVNEALPAVHAAFPGVAVDAYCESGAWSVEETVRLLRAAKDLGHPVRVHADQFTALGMLDAAVDLGAISVDHLEASTAEGLARLGASPTFGVGLPCSGFHLMSRGRGAFADLRSLVDAGGAAVIASNANPGSAPGCSIPFAMAIACRGCGLSPDEAISAATINPAALLGFSDRGAIVPGARADLVLLDESDDRMLTYDPSRVRVARTMVGGLLFEPGERSPMTLPSAPTTSTRLPRS